MKDKEGAERACANPNPVIDGRKANVNLAYLGAKAKGGHSQPSTCVIVNSKGNNYFILQQALLGYFLLGEVNLRMPYSHYPHSESFETNKTHTLRIHV